MESNYSKHVTLTCPTNEMDNCNFQSVIEDKKIVSLKGFNNNPFTKGAICPTAKNTLANLEHPDRLKYPLYQEKKGSGNFKEISWEQAFQLMSKHIGRIYEKNAMLLPLAWLKGTANNGIHHFVVDEFFASLKRTTRIVPANYYEAASNMQLYKEDFQSYSSIKDASLVIIWGTNTKKTNPSLMHLISSVQLKGGKIIVVDPISTITAQSSDLHLPIPPHSDYYLLTLILKELVKKDAFNFFVSSRLKPFIDDISSYTTKYLLEKCNITNDQFLQLINLLTLSDQTVHIVGNGLEKHSQYDQFYNTLRILKQYGEAHSNKRHYIFKRKKRPLLFNNQLAFNPLNTKSRLLTINDILKSERSLAKHPIEMLVVSGSNPLNRYGNSSCITQLFNRIPFVVTIEQFLTPTALQSNLILPTTTFFEEQDLVINNWEYGLQINEKALNKPYFNSLSEFQIFNQLANNLKKCMPNITDFPNYTSEEDYLNKQWNKTIETIYQIKNLEQLRENGGYQKADLDMLEEKLAADVPITSTVLPKSYSPLEPPSTYPFWLISSRHANENEREEKLYMNKNEAELLNITNHEKITLQNDLGSVTIEVELDETIPKNVLHYVPSSSIMTQNKILPILSNQTFEIISVYSRDIFHTINDTFVAIKKGYIMFP